MIDDRSTKLPDQEVVVKVLQFTNGHPDWLKKTAKLMFRSASRSIFVVCLISSLFFEARIDEPPTSDTFVFATLPLAVYLVTSIILIVKYFPRIANADAHNTVYYLWDLAVHAALLIIIYALIFKRMGLLLGSAKVEDPADFLYFSIITWTTVGFGDIVPTPSSRMFAASEALCGYVYMGLYLAIVLQVLAGYTKSNTTNLNAGIPTQNSEPCLNTEALGENPRSATP
jgi:Ion channel